VAPPQQTHTALKLLGGGVYGAFKWLMFEFSGMFFFAWGSDGRQMWERRTGGRQTPSFHTEYEEPNAGWSRLRA
jgi:hypothetical protein